MGVGVGGSAADGMQKEKRCDDGEELQLQKQIESLYLLKELPSSPECWPCGAGK